MGVGTKAQHGWPEWGYNRLLLVQMAGMRAAPGHADGTNEWKYWASELSSD